MKAHDLAKKLLEGPNLKIALKVYGHSYDSEKDRYSHGEMVVREHHNNYREQCMFIANSKHELNHD